MLRPAEGRHDLVTGVSGHPQVTYLLRPATARIALRSMPQRLLSSKQAFDYRVAVVSKGSDIPNITNFTATRAANCQNTSAARNSSLEGSDL